MVNQLVQLIHITIIAGTFSILVVALAVELLADLVLVLTVLVTHLQPVLVQTDTTAAIGRVIAMSKEIMKQLHQLH
jgi:hypothetical protein